MAGLERELELARRQIAIERRKQEEMGRERERCAQSMRGWGPGVVERLPPNGGLPLALLLRRGAPSCRPSVPPLSAPLAQAEQGAHHRGECHRQARRPGGRVVVALVLGGLLIERRQHTGAALSTAAPLAAHLPHANLLLFSHLCPACRCGWRR